MRKEVKLGMTLGGGVVAALVGYLLVAPPANKKGATLAGAGDAPGGNGSIIDAQQPGDLQAGGGSSAEAANTSNNGAAGQAPAGGAGASEQKPAADVQPKVDEKPKAGADQWGLLNSGQGKPVGTANVRGGGSNPPKDQPVTAKPHQQPKSSKVSETSLIADTRRSGGDAAPLYYNPNDAWGDGVSDGVVLPAASGRGAKASATEKPAEQAGPVSQPKAGSSHVVQSGETFSSIAQAAYGSAAYFPHLIRANPAANPNNLKLGSVITIPPMDQVKATGGTATATGNASVVEEVKIDPVRQYRVVSGDSLYKISLKVYGKSTYVDKLYEANKAAIGSNPTKLKLGMVLDLPEKAATAAPTVTAGGPGNESDPK